MIRLRAIALVCLLLAPALAHAGPSSPAPRASSPSATSAMTAASEALAPQVRATFERSCAECHDLSRRARPKGGFGRVLDLPWLAASDYVVPGQPAKSELYTVLLDPDPDVVMPPPDCDAPKPTPDEIQLVARWIAALAPSATTGQPAEPANNTPAPPPSPPATPPSAIAVPPPAPTTSAPATDLPRPATAYVKPSPSPATLFARTHPLLVHFPIALLLLAAVVEWLGWMTGRRAAWLPGVKWMLGASALVAPLAALAGWLLVGPAGHGAKAVFAHRWLGVSTAAIAIICWAVLVVAERRDGNRLRLLARILLLAAAVLVSLAGHTGGELVYGPGYPF